MPPGNLDGIITLLEKLVPDVCVLQVTPLSVRAICRKLCKTSTIKRTKLCRSHTQTTDFLLYLAFVRSPSFPSSVVLSILVSCVLLPPQYEYAAWSQVLTGSVIFSHLAILILLWTSNKHQQLVRIFTVRKHPK